MTKNLSVSVGQAFATVPMWKIRYTMVIGWGREGWVRVKGVEVEGLGQGVGPGSWAEGLGSGELGWGLGVGNPDPDQPQSSYPPAQPNYPTSTPLTPALPTPTYHRCVANLPHWHCCKHLSDAYAQILSHIRCVANLLCGESSVANLPCGESSG